MALLRKPVLFFAVAAILLSWLQSPAIAQQTWTEQTTAAAMGYCLARHPYIARDPNDPYTADGFEILASPGVLGAVRRNYVFQRLGASITTPDAGQNQSCDQACGQFGMNYGSAAIGRPLMYRDPAGNLVADGIGDMASLGFKDFDFYNDDDVIAGMWGRPLNYHESDVAQADLCCCQLDTSAPAPPTRACVQFEQPLIVGMQYGAATGQNPGDLVFTENGITVTVEKFQQVSGNTEFNEAMIDNLLVPGAATQSLRLNNIVVRFDMTALAYMPQGATVYYVDYGGSEHLSVNDDPPIADDLATMSGATNGGAVVTVTPGTGGPGNTSGELKIAGAMKSLALGGQEFWIDAVCAEP
jgi:hypothetical protein